ncbi:hypothetical protein Q7C36_019921 [Tachysurus vachellii]|uniref:Uncharacterized protein n=1 Tax=Tachysurus vachellii TaxID=175792 RepID=A0AA88RX82_TACVA|nr:hypothetical protein Q7C36_019921 [Tachysurus vachellii]
MASHALPTPEADGTASYMLLKPEAGAKVSHNLLISESIDKHPSSTLARALPDPSLPAPVLPPDKPVMEPPPDPKEPAPALPSYGCYLVPALPPDPTNPLPS